MKDFAIFYGEKIILRNLFISDTLHYFQYMTDPLIQPFLSHSQKISTLGEAKRDIHYWSSLFPKKQGCYWAITLKSHELIGTIGFHEINSTHHRASLSYDLNPKYWNQKIMSEAFFLLLRHTPSLLKLKRIQATVAHFNLPSITLLEKFSFQKEGLLKNYELIHDQYIDYWMYAFCTL